MSILFFKSCVLSVNDKYRLVHLLKLHTSAFCFVNYNMFHVIYLSTKVYRLNTILQSLDTLPELRFIV